MWISQHPVFHTLVFVIGHYLHKREKIYIYIYEQQTPWKTWEHQKLASYCRTCEKKKAEETDINWEKGKAFTDTCNPTIRILQMDAIWFHKNDNKIPLATTYAISCDLSTFLFIRTVTVIQIAMVDLRWSRDCNYRGDNGQLSRKFRDEIIIHDPLLLLRH